MSANDPAFRWSNACVGGPRPTSKLPYGPLTPDEQKKMGLVNGVCPAMGSMYCFTQCELQPHEDCPVVEDSAVLAGEETNRGTPCQSCTLPCPCKVPMAEDTHFPHVVGASLVEQEARMLEHLNWWSVYCVSIREQT